MKLSSPIEEMIVLWSTHRSPSHPCYVFFVPKACIERLANVDVYPAAQAEKELKVLLKYNLVRCNSSSPLQNRR